MTEQNERPDAPKREPVKHVGTAQGGADATGPGNILAGVQPSHEKADDSERRHD